MNIIIFYEFPHALIHIKKVVHFIAQVNNNCIYVSGCEIQILF